jgi:hypothetical protein
MTSRGHSIEGKILHANEDNSGSIEPFVSGELSLLDL